MNFLVRILFLLRIFAIVFACGRKGRKAPPGRSLFLLIVRSNILVDWCTYPSISRVLPDTTAPVVRAPENIRLHADSGQISRWVSWQEPVIAVDGGNEIEWVLKQMNITSPSWTKIKPDFVAERVARGKHPTLASQADRQSRTRQQTQPETPEQTRLLLTYLVC